MTNDSEKHDRRFPFEDVGRRMDEEIEKLISYINDEVVPSVRTQSTKGMRVAAEKLNSLADYMEHKQSAKTSSPDSESNTGPTKS